MQLLLWSAWAGVPVSTRRGVLSWSYIAVSQCFCGWWSWYGVCSLDNALQCFYPPVWDPPSIGAPQYETHLRGVPHMIPCCCSHLPWQAGPLWQFLSTVTDLRGTIGPRLCGQCFTSFEEWGSFQERRSSVLGSCAHRLLSLWFLQTSGLKTKCTYSPRLSLCGLWTRAWLARPAFWLDSWYVSVQTLLLGLSHDKCDLCGSMQTLGLVISYIWRVHADPCRTLGLSLRSYDVFMQIHAAPWACQFVHMMSLCRSMQPLWHVSSYIWCLHADPCSPLGTPSRSHAVFMQIHAASWACQFVHMMSSCRSMQPLGHAISFTWCLHADPCRLMGMLHWMTPLSSSMQAHGRDSFHYVSMQTPG